MYWKFYTFTNANQRRKFANLNFYISKFSCRLCFLLLLILNSKLITSIRKVKYKPPNINKCKTQIGKVSKNLIFTPFFYL